MSVGKYACLDVCVCVSNSVCFTKCMNVSMYVCVRQCMHVGLCMYVRRCVNAYAGLHMHTHRCIHQDMFRYRRAGVVHTTGTKKQSHFCHACTKHHIILPGGEMHRNSDGNASFTKSYKGAQTYVSPQKRHWPVYDTSIGEYQDASNYLDAEAPEDERESMLELTKEESWDLAPIRIFMELRRERGKLTQARASIRLILHSPVIGYLQDSPTHTHKHPPTKTTPRQTHQHPTPHTRKITTKY